MSTQRFVSLEAKVTTPWMYRKEFKHKPVKSVIAREREWGREGGKDYKNCMLKKLRSVIYNIYPHIYHFCYSLFHSIVMNHHLLSFLFHQNHFFVFFCNTVVICINFSSLFIWKCFHSTFIFEDWFCST